MIKKVVDMFDYDEDDGNKFTKHDSGKLDYSLVSDKDLAGMVRVLMYGANKYKRDNWKTCSSKEDINRIYSAMRRHLAEYQEGNFIDEESGLPHIDHALCNLFFLSHFYHRSKQ